MVQRKKEGQVVAHGQGSTFVTQDKKKEKGGLKYNFNAESQRPLMGPLPLLLPTTSPAFECKFDSRGSVVRGRRKTRKGVQPFRDSSGRVARVVA